MQVVGGELQKIELELQKCVEVRQRLDSQLNENDQVKKVRVFLILSMNSSVSEIVSLLYICLFVPTYISTGICSTQI